MPTIFMAFPLVQITSESALTAAEQFATLQAELAKCKAGVAAGKALSSDTPLSVPKAVSHVWEFEADRPRLQKGEIPFWKVVNMNEAIKS